MNGREAHGRLKDEAVPLAWLGMGLWNRWSWVHILPPPPVNPHPNKGHSADGAALQVTDIMTGRGGRSQHPRHLSQ